MTNDCLYISAEQFNDVTNKTIPFFNERTNERTQTLTCETSLLVFSKEWSSSECDDQIQKREHTQMGFSGICFYSSFLRGIAIWRSWLKILFFLDWGIGFSFAFFKTFLLAGVGIKMVGGNYNYIQ